MNHCIICKRCLDGDTMLLAGIPCCGYDNFPRFVTANINDRYYLLYWRESSDQYQVRDQTIIYYIPSENRSPHEEICKVDGFQTKEQCQRLLDMKSFL